MFNLFVEIIWINRTWTEKNLFHIRINIVKNISYDGEYRDIQYYLISVRTRQEAGSRIVFDVFAWKWLKRLIDYQNVSLRSISPLGSIRWSMEKKQSKNPSDFVVLYITWIKNGVLPAWGSAVYLRINKYVPVGFWQTPSTQSQPETPLQSELLPELTGTAQTPPAEHIVTPPSTVDTAALSEEPLPGERGRGLTWSLQHPNSPPLYLVLLLFVLCAHSYPVGQVETGNTW